MFIVQDIILYIL